VSTATDTRQRNRRGEGELLRAALLKAGGELLLELGDSEKLSVRAVTARAGVSPTALYLHFADRDELLREVCNQSFEELRSYMRAADDEHAGDPRAQIAAIGRAYLRFASEHAGAYRIIFSLPAGKGDMHTDLDEPPTGAEDPGIGAFEDLVAAVGRLSSDEESALATSIQLWAALHGFVTLRQAMPLFTWPDSESFLQSLWRAHFSE
jgi:AcrR family transcriptional regulator